MKAQKGFNPNNHCGSDFVFVFENDHYWCPRFDDIEGILLGRAQAILYEWVQKKYVPVPIDGKIYMTNSIPLLLRYDFGNDVIAKEGDNVPFTFIQGHIKIAQKIIPLNNINDFELRNMGLNTPSSIRLTYEDNNKSSSIVMSVTAPWQTKLLDDMEDHLNFTLDFPN